MAKSSKWTSRIVGHEKVRADQLTANPSNHRRHPQKQRDVVEASIRELGFVKSVIVNKRTGFILDGHERVFQALGQGDDTLVDVEFVDLSPEEEKKALLILDKISEWATIDADALDELIREVQTGEEAIADLIASMAEENGLLDLADNAPIDEDDVPEPPAIPITQPGDLWILGRHRVLCGDSTNAEDVERLMAGSKADLWLTDPPYNVDYTGKTKDALKVENDSMSDTDFRSFLIACFSRAFDVMKPGASYYIWHADIEGYNFRGAVFECNQKVRQCLIWVKQTLVMGRQDYHWKHEPCQPPGTMVRTPAGEVPIESLIDGDRVVSYNKYSGQITGMRDGRSVKVATRQYDGNLYGVKVSDKQTWTTDTHKFSVRFATSAGSTFCTYLMRRGDWWRVGITSTYNARGFGLKHRMRQEFADEAWIISIHETKLDAVVAEQILSVKYGIPQTHWETERGFKVKPYENRTTEMIGRIYGALDLGELESRASQLLSDFGRRRDLPFVSKETRCEKCSRRVTVQVAACNLVPGLMEVPVPYQQWDELKTFDWMPIESVAVKKYNGPVHSLDVETDQHYVADGIVTHNCLYGWREGGSHGWYTDRKQTTVLEFDRPSRSEDHPTMKPVALFAYQIRNSTAPNAIVFDSFLGSGTTVIAAEQLGRDCYGMEISPAYCDVVIKRWENLTGLKAQLAK